MSIIKRIVLTGGPGTGKTSLIHALQKRGLPVEEEISRDIIKEAQQEGIDQLFLEDPLHFSQRLLEGRIAQFNRDSVCAAVYYDRGIPDVLAYMDYAGQEYPEHFVKACADHRYDQVFILPPWEAIYKTDTERYETFETATALYFSILECYKRFNYKPIEVPQDTIDSRADFVLQNIV